MRAHRSSETFSPTPFLLVPPSPPLSFLLTLTPAPTLSPIPVPFARQHHRRPRRPGQEVPASKRQAELARARPRRRCGCAVEVHAEELHPLRARRRASFPRPTGQVERGGRGLRGRVRGGEVQHWGGVPRAVSRWRGRRGAVCILARRRGVGARVAGEEVDACFAAQRISLGKVQ